VPRDCFAIALPDARQRQGCLLASLDEAGEARMWRYLAGGAAALLMVLVSVLIFNARARSDPAAAAPALASPPPQTTATNSEPLPDTVPEATARTREEKRFGRYDKDRDGKITREEYLTQRRKAYARLDLNHDGVLQFDEWAAKAEAKFAGADNDRSGAMNAAEFATTAVKRKPARRADCAPPRQAPEEES